jgi:hypothetical protein
MGPVPDHMTPATAYLRARARVDAIHTARIITAAIIAVWVGHSRWGILAGLVHTGGENTYENGTLILAGFAAWGILAKAQHRSGENTMPVNGLK